MRPTRTYCAVGASSDWAGVEAVSEAGKVQLDKAMGARRTGPLLTVTFDRVVAYAVLDELGLDMDVDLVSVLSACPEARLVLVHCEGVGPASVTVLG